MPVSTPASGIAYASFDVFPFPKGAGIHIREFTAALAEAFGPLALFTLEPPREGPPAFPVPEGVEHHPVPVLGGNLVERALSFRRGLFQRWGGMRFRAIHVRSVFEGYPIARDKDLFCDALVFEANAFPSVELKYHYPAAAEDREFLGKVTAQEDLLLERADLIVTPSAVTARYMHGRGADPGKIRVIPNGVDPEVFAYRPPEPWGERPPKLLYAGTMTAWQGVHQAIEALALYRRDFEATLTLVGPARHRLRVAILDRCREAGVADAVTLLDPVDQPALARLHHESDAVLAPLTPSDRNLAQGCCPIKVLEAMASGTPLIASDMDAVRDLTGPHALLVRPGSGKAIKDAMLRLKEDPCLPLQLAEPARARVLEAFTWKKSGEGLVQAYEETLGYRRGPGGR